MASSDSSCYKLMNKLAKTDALVELSLSVTEGSVNNATSDSTNKKEKIARSEAAQRRSSHFHKEDSLLDQEEDYYDSVSYYLCDVPDKLSWSKRQDVYHLDVFWRSGHGNDDPKTTLSSSIIAGVLPNDKNDASIGKIITALQLFKMHCCSFVLLQFWAPVFVGNQTFLSTSHLPFGLLYLQPVGKRSCLEYRKLCMEHKYCVADGDDKNEHHFGPIGRVYSSGLPEYNPEIGDYSIQEYPLRDLAQQSRAKTYFALPVFESLGQPCVGVLEIVTSSWLWDQHSRVGYLETLYEALEEAGFTSPDISLSKCWDVIQAEKEIKEGLKMVCQMHDIPLAQTWVTFSRGNIGETIFRVREDLYCDVSEEYSFFRDEVCSSSVMKVVGKAYSSLTSSFCKDVSRLRKEDYFFADKAKNVNLTGCFVICLRSSYTGFSVYVLEFFLPIGDQIACKEPWAFLDSLIHTMKHHFPSFKIACGIELGEELSVEVFRLSEDDEFDSFRICQTSGPSPILGCSPNEVQDVHQQLARVVDNASLEQRITIQEFSPNEGDRMQLDRPNQSLPSDPNAATVHGEEEIVHGLSKRQRVVAPLDEERTVMTFSREDITLEVLQQHFGKKLEEAANDLGVSRSTLKRVCRQHNIRRWPSHTREKIKRSFCTRNANKQMAHDCQSHTDAPNQGINTINVHPLPQVSTLQIESPMTIKVKYGTDMIMFELFGSSRMTELVDEVTKRLKLQADTFKVKFLDEEDDWILLTRDEDLYQCMRRMKSLSRTTVRMLIEPII